MTQTKGLVNGIDVARLMQTIGQIKDTPELAQFQFRARNRWLGADRNRSHIKEFHGAGQEDATRSEPFVMDNGEPAVLLGQDEAPNPVEYVLHALAGCLTTTLAYHAASRGIEVESIESSLEGEIDIQGFLGLRQDVPKGYQAIRVTMKVKSDAPAEKLAELAKLSPVFSTLTNPLDVTVKVRKQD